jgi:hypothetical protein
MANSAYDRRGFIRVGSIATFGHLNWGQVLRAQAQSGKPKPTDISVIHLWLAGGLSHLDTFDMKLGSDRKYRTPFAEIPTSVPGGCGSPSTCRARPSSCTKRR